MTRGARSSRRARRERRDALAAGRSSGGGRSRGPLWPAPQSKALRAVRVDLECGSEARPHLRVAFGEAAKLGANLRELHGNELWVRWAVGHGGEPCGDGFQLLRDLRV